MGRVTHLCSFIFQEEACRRNNSRRKKTNGDDDSSSSSSDSSTASSSASSSASLAALMSRELALQTMSDFAFVCGDEVLARCNSVIVSLNSPVFARMAAAGMREARCESFKHFMVWNRMAEKKVVMHLEMTYRKGGLGTFQRTLTVLGIHANIIAQKCEWNKTCKGRAL